MTNELLTALNAERYGTGHWFKTPEPAVLDDSDTTTARRRRELLAAVEHTYAKEA